MIVPGISSFVVVGVGVADTIGVGRVRVVEIVEEVAGDSERVEVAVGVDLLDVDSSN